MAHLQIALVVTHIIAFATGYYLCMKNTRPKQTLMGHGLEPEEEPEERITPRPDSDKGTSFSRGPKEDDQ